MARSIRFGVPARPTAFAAFAATGLLVALCAVPANASAAGRLTAANNSPPGLAAATVQVGNSPVAVAADQDKGLVWVANAGSDSVTEINSNTLQVLATVPLASSPGSLAVFDGDVWVGSRNASTVTEISEATAAVVDTVTVGTLADTPLVVAAGPADEYVSVASASTGSVWDIETADNTIGGPFSVGTGAGGLAVPGAYTGALFWVTEPGTDSVDLLKSSLAVVTVPVGANPQGISVDPATKTVLVANEGDGTISEIAYPADTVTATISAHVPAGGQFAIAADPTPSGYVDPRMGYAWVTDTADDSLLAISEATGAVAQDIPVGSQPDALAFSWPGIWVANEGDGTVTDVSLPEVTIPPVAAIYNVGDQFSLQVGASGYPAVTLTVQSLPPGLTMSSSGLISGDFQLGGVYAIAIDATNSLTTTQSSEYVTVDQPPTPGQVDSGIQFTAGQISAGAWLATIVGYPAPVVTVSGRVPAGLTVGCGGFGSGPNFTECDITGTPKAGTGGLYRLALTGANGLGPAVTETVPVVVNQAPAITSAAKVTFRPGKRASFTIRTSGYPVAQVSVSGKLPKGLKLRVLTNGTAVITGTPARSTQHHTYRLTITAQNGGTTSASQVLKITVS